MSELRTALGQAIAATASALTRRKTLAQAYHEMWDHPQGKLVLRDILNRCSVLEEAEAPSDADERSVRAGRRLIAIHIFERMRWSDIELAELAREQDRDRLEQTLEAA